MKNLTRKIELLALCSIIILLVYGQMLSGQSQKGRRTSGLKTIQLPSPNLTGSVSVEEAINKRQKSQGFTDKPLGYEQIGQLAWAGMAIAGSEPNNRSSIQLELYFLNSEGLFSYNPGLHLLEQVSQIDLRKQLSTTINQDVIAQAGCSIIIATSMKKMPAKPGSKAARFPTIEASQSAESICLQAAAMGLETALVSEFDARNIEKVCRLSGDITPLLIVSVGFPQEQKPQEQASVKSTTLVGSAVLIVPSVNFKDDELYTIQRTLTEAGINVVLASSKVAILRGMSGGTAYPDRIIENVRVEDFNAVVFVGGRGAAEYFDNPAALELARQVVAKQKVLAAISTAPAILANAGVLKGVRATAFLSERGIMLKGGANYTGTSLERDGLIITSSDSSVATAFAKAIVTTIAENRQ